MDKSGRTLTLAITLRASFCKLFIIKLWRYGIRTPDLLIANETLYQLSYTPNLINFRKLHGNLRKRERCLSIPS